MSLRKTRLHLVWGKSQTGSEWYPHQIKPTSWTLAHLALAQTHWSPGVGTVTKSWSWQVDEIWLGRMSWMEAIASKTPKHFSSPCPATNAYALDGFRTCQRPGSPKYTKYCLIVHNIVELLILLSNCCKNCLNIVDCFRNIVCNIVLLLTKLFIILFNQLCFCLTNIVWKLCYAYKIPCNVYGKLVLCTENYVLCTED